MGCARPLRFDLRATSPESLNRVGIEGGIGAHERNVLDEGLRDQEPVEGIAMMKRQAGDFVRVPQLDGQKSNTIEAQLSRDEGVERLGNGKPAEVELDRDLPDARDAQERFVTAIADHPLSMRAELGVRGDEPEERMRIEKDTHGHM